MTALRRVSPLPLLLIGLAALAAGLVVIPWVVQAQSQEVTPTQAATGSNPPAKPTSLQASSEHDSVTLTWTASTDQTVTHYAILRRNPGTDASQVFHVIESNAGPETSYSDGTVSASTTYIYRVKSVSPTGVSQWSGYVKVETPAAPDSTLEPTPTPTATPSPEPVSTPAPEDLRPTGLTVSLVDNKVSLSWTAPAEDAGSVDGYEILRRRPMEGESALATLVADTESTATTYTDATANEAGVRYVYRVKALRGDDVSLWSNFDKTDLPADYVPDPTPTPEPESTSDDQAPTGLSAALADGGGVALTWTAPAEDADSVTGYEILRAVGEGEFTTLAADTASTTTSHTDTTATEAGETYAYQVKAIRGEDRSEASGQAQVQLPHDPVDLSPTGLTAVVLTASLVVVGEDPTASTSVSLSWTAPAEDADSVTGYEILRAVGDGEVATLKADTGSTSTFYNDATATQSGTSYTYKVKAIRGEDRSQASGQAQVQLPHDAVDLAPSGLTAEAVDGGGVDLSWTAPAEDADSVTGYEVLRAVGEGDMATLAADTASAATTYTDATATGEGETYAYRVKAIRGQARSQGSNRVALVPVEPPATPENLKPTNLTFEIREDGVTLAWDAPAADADSVTGYRVVRRRPNQGENEWLVWKWDTGSTETTYRDGYARTHGDYYMYRVRALRGDDYSKMSNRVDVRRPQATLQTAEWAPSNLRALVSGSITIDEHGNLQVGDDAVQLNWDAPAEGVEWVRGYEVQRATCDGDFAALAADTGSTATAHADAEFEEGETYTYRVRARRPQGLSLWSGTQTLLVPGGAGESECAAPTFLPSQVQDPQTGLTPATLLNTLLGYDEAEGTGTLAPNELVFGEDGAFRVTSVNAWPGNSGLVLYLTAGSSEQDAALADRDFVLEAKETVLVVGETEFSFDDAVLSHSDTTGDNAEYTGVVIATWTEGQAGLVAGETVAFRLLLRSRPDEAQFTTHETEVVLVKNTGQTAESAGLALDATVKIRGQAFTTGAHTDGYVLGSVGVDFHTIANTSTAGDQVSVTLTTDYRGNLRGLTLCALRDPSSFTGSGVQRFDAPTKVPCPRLTPNTSYYVLIERVTTTSDAISLSSTLSDNEDIGQIANKSRYLDGSRDFISDPGSNTLQIVVYGSEIRSAVRLPTQDFITLAEGNDRPNGLWSDGTTMWVSQRRNPINNSGGPPKIFAYDMATKAHKPTEDFDTLDAVGNDTPGGIWSDGTTMFVLDERYRNIYAYDMATKQRDRDKEVWGMWRALPRFSQDIWSDGDNMWVAKCCGPSSHGVLAYLFDADLRVEDKDIRSTVLHANLNNQPFGIWADETTMFVSDINDGIVYAYWKTWGVPQPGRNIQLNPLQRGADDGWGPRGIWSDGFTMWVADRSTDAIYAYTLPPPESPLGFQRRVSVESVIDTTAIVAVDLRSLPFGGQRQAVKMSILYGGHTIYAHPEAEEARFMLRGLEPESQYTVNVRFGSSPGARLGAARFRTDYARLDKIEASGLTHSEVTLKVSLLGADLDERCCIRYWVSSDRTEPEHTFYLRHRASDETGWSEPVELTFADLVADVRLTGLEPGTDYDVELAPNEDFAPPSTSVASYAGTLTVGEDDGFGFVGYDGVGSFGDPFGSLTQTTFNVGGVERSINYLQTHPFGGPDLDQPALLLEFDATLPASVGELEVGFTLTVGTTVYNSTDARRTGESGYEWASPPSWSEDDMVTVEIGFAEAVPFRAGTTLEWSFSTPPLPQTLAFEAEMTVGVTSTFDGYSDVASTGSISSDTFEVGGVEYTVDYAGFEKGTNNLFALTVDPALPYDAFTLTLGSTELLSSGASVTVGSNGVGIYTWSGTNPSWASGATVDVKLDIGLIDICDRSPAVAAAIKAATPSFDFCHMTSPIDLANLTELDLPNGRGTGLKVGDFEGLSGLTHLDLSRYDLGGLWPQLPVGVFNGLESLTHLDISHTHLMSLDLGVFDGLDNLVELDLTDTLLRARYVPVGVFDGLDSLEILRMAYGGYQDRGITFVDEDIFRGLDTLRELDVRPIRPPDDVLAPLTSLETLNGQGYTP